MLKLTYMEFFSEIFQIFHKERKKLIFKNIFPTLQDNNKSYQNQVRGCFFGLVLVGLFAF